MRKRASPYGNLAVEISLLPLPTARSTAVRMGNFKSVTEIKKATILCFGLLFP